MFYVLNIAINYVYFKMKRAEVLILFIHGGVRESDFEDFENDMRDLFYLLSIVTVIEKYFKKLF